MTERRREYTNLGSDLGARKGQVSCHASVLAFAMKALRLSLTASSTSADHQALGWRLMRPKEMKDLAAFSAREVKRAAAEERKRNEYSSAEGQ